MKYNAQSLQVNGKERKDLKAATVEQLVFELGLCTSTVLVEHNHTALHRKDWAATLLQPGDCIEFLQIAAGG